MPEDEGCLSLVLDLGQSLDLGLQSWCGIVKTFGAIGMEEMYVVCALGSWGDALNVSSKLMWKFNCQCHSVQRQDLQTGIVLWISAMVEWVVGPG